MHSYKTTITSFLWGWNLLHFMVRCIFIQVSSQGYLVGSTFCLAGLLWILNIDNPRLCFPRSIIDKKQHRKSKYATRKRICKLSDINIVSFPLSNPESLWRLHYKLVVPIWTIYFQNDIFEIPLGFCLGSNLVWIPMNFLLVSKEIQRRSFPPFLRFMYYHPCTWYYLGTAGFTCYFVYTHYVTVWRKWLVYSFPCSTFWLSFLFHYFPWSCYRLLFHLSLLLIFWYLDRAGIHTFWCRWWWCVLSCIPQTYYLRTACLKWDM